MRKKGLIIITVGILGLLGLVLWLVLGGSGGKKSQPSPSASSGVSFGGTKSNGQNSGSSTSSGGTSGGTSGAAPSAQVIHDSIAYAVTQAGSSNFSVENVGQPVDGWFVVNIAVPGGEGGSLIMRQSSSGNLVVVEGPGTSFARSVLINDGVPQAIQDQVLVYDDN